MRKLMSTADLLVLVSQGAPVQHLDGCFKAEHGLPDQHSCVQAIKVVALLYFFGMTLLCP